MASTTDIKKGICFVYNNDIFKVVDFQHIKPGKGAAFVYVKMKSVTKGNVLENNFPSGHKIDIVRVEMRQSQYLFKDEMGLNFMDTENFEQFFLPDGLIDNSDLMKEGLMLDISFNAANDLALSATLPTVVVLAVTYTEPGEKGNTATNALKTATLETGAEVKVPLFVNTGDVIRINSETRDYMDRVKS